MFNRLLHFLPVIVIGTPDRDDEEDEDEEDTAGEVIFEDVVKEGHSYPISVRLILLMYSFKRSSISSFW